MKLPRFPFPQVPRRLRELLLGGVLAITSLALTSLVLELLLRSVPAAVPRGVFYGSGAFDADLGFQLPHSKVIYNKVRYVERTPNADGFMDIPHEVEKPPGVVRVGFFGDSYVESVQVPLEDTFFRRLPPTLHGAPLEPFAFGLSGLGTLHARSLYQKFGRRYDLDLVVYLFVDNDPGDHLETLQQARRGLHASRPTARPQAEGAGFDVLPGAHPSTTTSTVRRLAMALKNRSLLVRALYARLQLLSRSGASTTTAVEAQDPPSTWPPQLRAEAEILTRRLLRTWHEEVRADGRQFLVFYVPRSEELEADLGEASWRQWLVQTCDDLEIPLIDPTAALAAHQRQSPPLYDDHWSPAGHAVVAKLLAEAIKGHSATALTARETT